MTARLVTGWSDVALTCTSDAAATWLIARTGARDPPRSASTASTAWPRDRRPSWPLTSRVREVPCRCQLGSSRLRPIRHRVLPVASGSGADVWRPSVERDGSAGMAAARHRAACVGAWPAGQPRRRCEPEGHRSQARAPTPCRSTAVERSSTIDHGWVRMRRDQRHVDWPAAEQHVPVGPDRARPSRPRESSSRCGNAHASVAHQRERLGRIASVPGTRRCRTARAHMSRCMSKSVAAGLSRAGLTQSSRVKSPSSTTSGWLGVTPAHSAPRPGLVDRDLRGVASWSKPAHVPAAPGAGLRPRLAWTTRLTRRTGRSANRAGRRSQAVSSADARLRRSDRAAPMARTDELHQPTRASEARRAPGGGRTHTERCLRPLPLPIGIPGRVSLSSISCEARPPADHREPSSAARPSTASSIGSVSRPVKVFCCEGW